MTLYVVLYVCTLGQPCDARHARAFQAFTAPPGVIVCGVPATMTIVQSPAGPSPEREYIKQRCELRSN